MPDPKNVPKLPDVVVRSPKANVDELSLSTIFKVRVLPSAIVPEDVLEIVAVGGTASTLWLALSETAAKSKNADVPRVDVIEPPFNAIGFAIIEIPFASNSPERKLRLKIRFAVLLPELYGMLVLVEPITIVK